MLVRAKEKITKEYIKRNLINATSLLCVMIIFYGFTKYVSSIYVNKAPSNTIDLSKEIKEIEQRNFHKESLSLIHTDDKLSPRTEQILKTAILDEYKSEATIASIVVVFGDIKPFSDITEDNLKHSTPLSVLFELYDMDLPENIYTQGKNVPKFNSLSEACELALNHEISNIKMYEEFINEVKEKDILVVFNNNKFISQNSHLPPLSNCTK